MKKRSLGSFKEIHAQVMDVFKGIQINDNPIQVLFVQDEELAGSMLNAKLPLVNIRPIQFHSKLSVIYQVEVITSYQEHRDQILWQLFTKCKDAGSVYKGSAATKIELPDGELSVYMFESQSNLLHPVNDTTIMRCSGRISFYPNER